MKLKAFAALLGVLVLTAASPAYAANKEHQQMMADLRMLQEQSQLLQNLLGTLTDTLKAVNVRLDQQAETTRKAFADQKLVIDNLNMTPSPIAIHSTDPSRHLASTRIPASLPRSM